MKSIRLLQKLWHYLTGTQKITLILVVIGNAFATLAVTLPSVVIGNIVSKLTTDAGAQVQADIVLLVALFAAFTILRAAIHIALHNVMPGIEVALRYEQIRHTLRTPIDDSDRKFTAELNATMGRGAKAAGDLIKITFADYLPAVLQLVIAAFLAVAVEPVVGALMLASGVVSFLITRAQLRSQDGVRVGIARRKSHLDGSMTELLKGKAIVRTLNAVDLESARVHEEARNLSLVERRHHRAMGLFDAGKAAVEGAFGVGVVLLGVYLVLTGANAGTVLTLYLLYTQFSMPLREIHRMRDEANEASVQLRQAFEILDEKIDPYFERRNNTTDLHAQSAIALRGVEIKYSDDVAAADISFEIKGGQFFGLCGPAGSGKTTVMKAIAGLVPVAGGEIKLLGQPLSEIGATEFADKIAYASQQPYLVAASIRQNLLFGLIRKPSDSELRVALEDAQMMDEVASMPHGLDTILGEGGLGLSGGQQQRVVLARMMLRRPSIILLDEATSALDNVNEARIMAMLQKRSLTMLAIAHRLTTLRGADSILVMRDGKIVQRGTYDALSSTDGEFRTLVRASHHPDDATVISS